MRTDSLERAIRYKDQYLDGVKKALSGTGTIELDTTALDVPSKEASID
jgi:hypothetical protein